MGGGPEKYDVGRRKVTYWERPDCVRTVDAADVDWRFHVIDLTRARMEELDGRTKPEVRGGAEAKDEIATAVGGQ